MSLAEDQRQRDAEIAAAKAEQVLKDLEAQRNVERAVQNKAIQEEAAKAEAERAFAINKMECERRIEAAEKLFRELREQEARNVEWTQRQNEPPGR